MFNVYLDGVYHSTHKTFTGACRDARTQAITNQQAYFTVFEAGDESEGLMLDAETEIMQGVPVYIVTPHKVMPNTSERRSVGVATLAAAASRNVASMSRGM